MPASDRDQGGGEDTDQCRACGAGRSGGDQRGRPHPSWPSSDLLQWMQGERGVLGSAPGSLEVWWDYSSSADFGSVTVCFTFHVIIEEFDLLMALDKKREPFSSACVDSLLTMWWYFPKSCLIATGVAWDVSPLTWKASRRSLPSYRRNEKSFSISVVPNVNKKKISVNHQVFIIFLLLTG